MVHSVAAQSAAVWLFEKRGVGGWSKHIAFLWDMYLWIGGGSFVWILYRSMILER